MPENTCKILSVSEGLFVRSALTSDNFVTKECRICSVSSIPLGYSPNLLCFINLWDRTYWIVLDCYTIASIHSTLNWNTCVRMYPARGDMEKYAPTCTHSNSTRPQNSACLPPPQASPSYASRMCVRRGRRRWRQ